MKKITYILITLCLACSSSDDGGTDPNTSTFDATIAQSATTIGIDQIVTLTANANETINEISFSTDGGTTFPSSFGSSFGMTANLYFDFETVGTKNIIFRLKNSAGDIVDKPIIINVERGSAVQITGVRLNSFFNIGQIWDSEFGNNDPNRLADVYFALLKRRLNVFTGERGGLSSNSIWYRSETRTNETNLNWDLQSENININLEQLTPYIAFVDDDGEGNLAGDLMLGPPFERLIPISDYLNSQPSSIIIEETDINLYYELGIDW